jgi:hypothetical protein
MTWPGRRGGTLKHLENRGISRRTLLRGLAGGALVTLGLPALEVFLNDHGTALAEDGPGASGFPRRFGLFFWGNGVLPDRWVPATIGANWQPSEQLAPLAHLTDRVTVVTGTKLGVPNSRPHFAGLSGVLCGAPVLDAYGQDTFALPSIDQLIAKGLGDVTRFASLEFGAAPSDGVSFNGPNSRNPPEPSPAALFARIFGGGFQLPGAEPIVDPRLALRRSILDAVATDLSKIKQVAGAADRARLDQHLEGVRSIERRLARLEEDPPNLAACAMPPSPLADYPDLEGRPQLQEKNAIFCELVAMALACDQTRVFSNMFSYPVTNILFEGAPSGHHQLTHDEPDPQPEVHRITLQCITAYARQVEALANVAEGAGTLLDSCALLGTSDVSLGKTHGLDEFPLLIAGSAGGRLKQGIHHRAAAENTSHVMLSLVRAVGVNAPSYGAEGGYVTDGMSDIEV